MVEVAGGITLIGAYSTVTLLYSVVFSPGTL